MERELLVEEEVKALALKPRSHPPERAKLSIDDLKERSRRNRKLRFSGAGPRKKKGPQVTPRAPD